MDSEEETLYDDNENDSGNESSGDDVDFAMEVESAAMRDRQNDTDDYPYEVLSTEEIVQHMVDCIKDVNTVVEVWSPFTVFTYFIYPKCTIIKFLPQQPSNFQTIYFV